jgi:hypothetical protein
MRRNVDHLKQYRWERVLVGLLIALLSAVALGRAFDEPDLYRTTGKVIAEGKNGSPVGALKLKTYRIEEVELPQPANVEVNGRNLQVDRAFRVTITGGPFPVRDLPAIIWLDDTPLKYAQESEDLSEVTAVTYDRSLLRDGAQISFSFGEKGDSYTALPEKLKLSASAGTKGGN